MLAGLGLYLFLVHMVYAREPLIRPELFKDVNFSSGLTLMFMVGVLMVSSLALMTPWLQVLSNYPVETAGLIMAPRGFGSLVDHHAGRAAVGESRRAAAGGQRVADALLYVLADDPLDARRVGARDHHRHRDPGRRRWGWCSRPLSVLAFVTLAPAMRTEGASLFSLLRNVGAAIGVSVFSSLLAHNSQAMHEMIGASVTPFNRALQTWAPGAHARGSIRRRGTAR